jgi:hypothetical protein
MKIIVRRNTIGLCRLYLFRTHPRIYMPAIDPRAHHPPIHAEKGTLRVPLAMYEIEEPRVENMIINMPVDEATEGATPMLSKRGLKIAPPPSPRAPDTQPPIKEKRTSLKTLVLVKSMSLLHSPLLYFTFKACSLITVRSEYKVVITHTAPNKNTKNQSRAEHLAIPMIDSVPLLPLKKLVITWNASTKTQTEIFNH